MLAVPKLVALDSATLGKVSLDYWSDRKPARDRARVFIERLKHNDVFVAFTLTHVCELLRHDNPKVVRNRISFLRSLPLIAWLRPYDGNWFPGAIPDLLRREIHAVVHGSARDWQAIISTIRCDLWQTGTGAEMFVERDYFWDAIRKESQSQHEVEKFVASIARTDPGGVSNLKLRDLYLAPLRATLPEKAQAIQAIAQDIHPQLCRHGDPRLPPALAAQAFARKTAIDVSAIFQMGGNPITAILSWFNVPRDCVTPNMTIAQVGELAVYIKQLNLLSANLRPPVKVTIHDLPPDTLPSYVLERTLRSFQQQAQRSSGSDMGDGHMAPLAFYADTIEVDKRTWHFLNQIRSSKPDLGRLMKPCLRSSDYARIPDHFE